MTMTTEQAIAVAKGTLAVRVAEAHRLINVKAEAVHAANEELREAIATFHRLRADLAKFD